MTTDLQEQTIKNQETTLVFCEQATRLLADVKQKYTEAGETFSTEDVAQLQEHINKQIQGYETLEIYGGLEIKSAKVELVDEKDLKLSFGVIPKQRMFKTDESYDSSFYLGWLEGYDVYVDEAEDLICLKTCNNSDRNIYLNLKTNESEITKEVRARLSDVYQHVV